MATVSIEEMDFLLDARAVRGMSLFRFPSSFVVPFVACPNTTIAGDHLQQLGAIDQNPSSVEQPKQVTDQPRDDGLVLATYGQVSSESGTMYLPMSLPNRKIGKLMLGVCCWTLSCSDVQSPSSVHSSGVF